MHNPIAAAQHRRPGISLALQGGGSLGAFTWGVLDALLEAEVVINAASGASAGAINAVVLAQGLMAEGPQGARAALERFWRRVSNASPLSGAPAGRAALAALQASPYLLSSVQLSPAQANPLRIDPLGDILNDEIDFEGLRRHSPVDLLVSTTRVSDGRARIFRTEELSLEVVLASACLPLVRHSVEIDGEWYWDGGYSANPPLRELVWATNDRDVLLIELPAPTSEARPRLTREIERRVHEIALTAAFHRELDAVGDLVEAGRSGGRPGAVLRFPGAGRPSKVRLHRISAREALEDVPSTHALDIGWDVLTRYRDSGAEAGRAWLAGQRLPAGTAVAARRRPRPAE